MFFSQKEKIDIINYKRTKIRHHYNRSIICHVFAISQNKQNKIVYD